MPRRVTSLTLVGRAEPLAVLRAAVADARGGQSRLVLVAGDAGIGKTRLMTEACSAAAAEGVQTAVGGCVQLGEVSVAYAPIVEALRDLRRRLGAEEFGGLLGDGRDDINALLGVGPTAESRGSGPLFEHLLGLLSHLGDTAPLLFVVEDVHWADASTRDLLAFLGRNLRESRIVLVLTYRADELHRRHPLRPLLADLERGPAVERITLAGLNRDALAELVRQISAEPITAEDLEKLLARSGGNPFYVEELVAAGGLHGALPAALADLILNRLDRLPASAQHALQRAAVVGHEVDEVLVATVMGEPVDSVSTSLREAVAQQLLVADSSGCRFRHALVREALYDDLLPGDRARVHVAAANAIAATPQLAEHVRWALVAYHWDAAHETTKALEASVRAGAEAEQVYALADAATHYERALGLFERVPDAADRIGMTHVDLLLRAAEAVSMSSQGPRGANLFEAALSEMDDSYSPERRAAVMSRLAFIYWVMRNGPSSVDAQQHAVAMLAGRRPSPEQAVVLARLGGSLMLRDLFRRAEPILREAISVARTVGATEVEAWAFSLLGGTLAGLGRADEGAENARRALSMSLERGYVESACSAYVNLAEAATLATRYDDAIQWGLEGIEYAARMGQMRYYGSAIAGDTIAALAAAGRWSEADQVRADRRLFSGEEYLQLRWLPLLIDRGDYQLAHTVLDSCLEITAQADDVQFRAAALILAGQLAAVEARWDIARSLFTDGLEAAAPTDDQRYQSRGFALALQAEADRIDAVRMLGARGDAEIATARATADKLVDAVEQFAEGKAAIGIALLPAVAAWLHTARIEHARAHGTDSATDWACVAQEWDAIGEPLPAARARYRQAMALLRDKGDRATATGPAAQALHTAETLGAAPLLHAVRQLAQRGRLDPGRRPRPPGGAAPDPAGAGGAQAGRRGPNQPPGRRDAVHQREDRKRPRHEHPAQARRGESRRSRGRRPPLRPAQRLTTSP